MDRHQFGSTGREVATIGQGSWYLERSDRRAAISALRRGLDLGMTHLDTAELYGSGEAEEVVAEAIAGRRDEVFLVSKIKPDHASRQGTLKACHQSLARLRTERLDCYLLHWPGRHPLKETIAAFEQLEREGKILSWGLSNFDVAGLEEARHIAGDGRVACNQVLYHLEERGIEHAVVPWCEEHGVAVVGYSPFGNAGRFPGANTPGGRVLGRIAAAHQATSRQVALRFLVRRLSLFAIPKSGNPEHVAENAGAGELRLTEAELVSIDEAFPLAARRRSLPTA